MAERICDKCGKKKKVEGGKTCESGHFICKDDAWEGSWMPSQVKYCPLCKKPLR